MSWPLSHEFNEAIQTPAAVFADPDLKGGDAVVGATGMPLPRSGNFADVYQVVGADGRNWAVKCFTRPVAGLAERYARVGAALAKAGLPFTVGFEFLPEGIHVGGAWRPVLKMEWVEGLLLNQVVRDNAGSAKVLTALGQMWVRLCKRLRDANVAHADVQHGNVLLVPGARAGAFGLKLIDYDGMWVPALANTPSGESGHPSYQHPARAAGRAYSPDLDRFPHLVVATALRGLAAGGAALWDKYDNGDNLLFEEGDFKNPAGSAVMADLWRTDDPAVQALVGRLAVACGKPIPQTPWLDQITTDAGDPRPLDDAGRREAAAAFGLSLPVAVSAPRPLPPPPAPAPAPEANPFDLVNEPAAAAAPRRPKPKPRPAAAPNRTPLYIAAAGVLLMLGAGVVGLVVMLGGKPAEVAQKKEEEQPPPPPPREGTRPTEKAQPKPPDKITPVPQPQPMPQPPEVVQPVPPGKLAAQETWKVELPPSSSGYPPTLTRDGTAVAANNGGKMILLDVATGARLADPPDRLFDNRIVGMANGAFGRARLGDPAPVWDARAGKVDRTLSPGRLPFPSYAFLSPTGKYVAAAPSGRDLEDRLFLQAADPERAVFETDWKRGDVFFPDDESRVLVSDATGRCRWFELPSGKAAETWAVPRSGGEIQALSGNGAVAALWVPPSDRPPGVVVLDARTGRELGFATQARKVTPSLSRDGRLLLVPFSGGRGEGAKVIDVAKGLVADVAPPAGFTTLNPVLLPDGTGCVAIAGDGDRRAVVRYDFRGDGVVAVKPPDPAPPVPMPAPAAAGKWTVPVEHASHNFRVSGRSNTVFAVSAGFGPAVALDLATGARRAEFADLGKGAVNELALVAGGRLAGWDRATRTVRLWDEKTGRALDPLTIPEVARPPGPAMRAYVAVSPDGRFAASGWHYAGTKKTEEVPESPLALIDLTTGRPVRELTAVNGDVHFTADGRALVAEPGGRFRWFKLPSGEPDGGFDLGRPASWSHVVHGISADGSVLAYFGPHRGGPRYGPLVLDGKTGAVVRQLPVATSAGGSQTVCVSADGRRAAWVENNGRAGTTLAAADLRTGAELARVPLGQTLCSVALSEDGATAVVSLTNGFERKFAMQAVPLPPPAGVVVARPPPAVPAAPAAPGLRWRTPTDKLYSRVLVSDGPKVVFSAAAGPGGVVALDLKTGEPRPDFADFAKGGGHYVAPFGEGKVATWRFVSRTLRLWDEKTGRDLGQFELPDLPPPADVKGHHPFHAPAPDAKSAVVGYDRSGPDRERNLPVALFDLGDNRKVRDLLWTGGHVHFTADGKRVLLAESGGKCRWFKMPSGEPDGEFDLGPPAAWKHELLGVSADGAVLAYFGPLGRTGGYGPASLDGKAGTVLRTFPPASNSNCRVCVSADGRRLAWTLNNNGASSAVAADARTGVELARYPVGGALASPALTADGSVLVVVASGAGADPSAAHAFDVGGGVVAVKPPDPPVVPKMPPVALDLPDLKARWGPLDVKAKIEAAVPAWDDDGKRVVLASTVTVAAAAFDAKTGLAGRELTNPALKGRFHRLIPLDGGKFAFQTETDRELLTWDPALGLPRMRPFTPPARGGLPTVNLSPNSRFLVVGGGAGEPLQVTDTTLNKTVPVEWAGGSTAFAADSSRLLVADDAGRFRWLKLPGAQPDGDGWTLGPGPGVAPRLLGVSADGGVVAVHARPAGKELTVHLLDGKTGRVLRSLPPNRYAVAGAAVAADGRVALVRDDGSGAPLAVEVFDATGAAVAARRFPPGVTAAAVSFEARAVAAYDRSSRLTVFDLPTAP